MVLGIPIDVCEVYDGGILIGYPRGMDGYEIGNDTG